MADMVAGGIAVPNALVEVMTDFVALDPTDWDAWQAAANEVEDAMWKEPCECGAMRVVTAFRDGAEQRREEPVNKLGSYGHRYATCDEQNDAEYEARIGERPEAALERRLSYLRAWDAVCHGTRVSNACWDALLSEDLQLRSPPPPSRRYTLAGTLMCDFATAMGLLELGPRDVLARLRKPLTDQHLVDVHRAIHLDDVAAFVSLVRERPRYLLEEVESGANGAQIGFVSTSVEPCRLTLLLSSTSCGVQRTCTRESSARWKPFSRACSRQASSSCLGGSRGGGRGGGR